MPSEQQTRLILPMFPPKASAGGIGSSTLLSLPDLHQSFIRGALRTVIGRVPVVEAHLSRQDILGSLKVRFGIGRMRYSIDPGLYALGNPDEKAPVVVSANYKLSFDCLREALPDRALWILVLDTKGVNVWCAAGKGTFGTEELIRRLQASGLEQVVRHRRLILPQLAAPGVAAHEVRKRTGFAVSYGPVEARDLPAYLDAGMKATEAMRRKTFPFRDRIVLVPMEWIPALKPLILLCFFFFMAAGMEGLSGWKMSLALDSGMFMVSALLGAFFAGTTITPVLFPWLPGRAFSVKGLCPAWFVVLILLDLRLTSPLSLTRVLESFSVLFLVPAASSYWAMKFTGSTPITSLSGVRKEMRRTLPLQIAGGLIGLVLWIAAKVLRIL
ncbi:acetyl-CoA decarbonylase/synthase complex subunit gamma [Syntrophus gentianae]|uniref:Acetyl-CoA decarbonylase/synthase complex subunit gamma n=1 Tax=Syntrophus gentianae TaxID=43775 RepID=A0A1H7ZYH0_9BACT|nr:mercury methylation corrinoid protein HgcA [Syntrophus gentianae]SEM63500.1 acetyl-CoA decarbonylase/synthase complex subunit gamma [Syntrophus gentianae]